MILTQEHLITIMSGKDEVFFQELGSKIAVLRKEHHMTQVELAEYLEISQQHMASFEKGIRKVPASFLPKLALLFACSIDELVGFKSKQVKRGPTSTLQRQVEQIGKLPRAKQKFAIEMLDTIIQQAQRR